MSFGTWTNFFLEKKMPEIESRAHDENQQETFPYQNSQKILQ